MGLLQDIAVFSTVDITNTGLRHLVLGNLGTTRPTKSLAGVGKQKDDLDATRVFPCADQAMRLRSTPTLDTLNLILLASSGLLNSRFASRPESASH